QFGLSWAFRVGPVLETDYQLVLFLGKGLAFAENESALLTVGGLVVVLFSIGVSQLEMHAAAIWHLKGVVAKIFGRLDVVLVSVGPVELYFLTLIRDGVNTFFVPSQ